MGIRKNEIYPPSSPLVSTKQTQLGGWGAACLLVCRYGWAAERRPSFPAPVPRPVSASCTTGSTMLWCRRRTQPSTREAASACCASFYCCVVCWAPPRREKTTPSCLRLLPLTAQPTPDREEGPVCTRRRASTAQLRASDRAGELCLRTREVIGDKDWAGGAGCIKMWVF
jgi:hypothetical protein